MRYISALAVAVLALVFGTATPAVAQPGGSYQQTCRKIGVRGSTLYAECQNTGGGWQSTQLRDYNRCNGEIQNINGSLQCTGSNRGGYGPNDGRGRDDHDRDRDHDGDRDHDRDRYNGAPRGSYYQTCQNVQVNGNTLTASCQKKNGKTRNTSLHNYQQCRDIENDNGKLRCR
jgi:CVNH domain-containing protein